MLNIINLEFSELLEESVKLQILTNFINLFIILE